MNSLEQMMGLDQYGYPQMGDYPDDPMMQYGMVGDEAAMMEQMGMPPMEDPYAMVGMEQPVGLDEGRQLSYDMLGGPAPQIGQDEINALAYSLGLGGHNSIVVDDMVDPMYSPRFDTMSLMGGY